MEEKKTHRIDGDRKTWVDEAQVEVALDCTTVHCTVGTRTPYIPD